MSNYSVSKAPEVNKNHCFKLTKGGARTYYMCAASESEMKKWMVSMMNAAKESAKDVSVIFQNLLTCLVTVHMSRVLTIYTTIQVEILGVSYSTADCPKCNNEQITFVLASVGKLKTKIK